MLEIKRGRIADLEKAPNIQALLEEYAAESAVPGLPHPSAKVEIYRALEASGALATIAAFIKGELVGFILVLTPVMAHYGMLIATTESYFVAKEHRASGAGLRLLRAAEQHAKAKGSPGLLVSAPLGGVLSEVLPKAGYAETNRVFLRSFPA